MQWINYFRGYFENACSQPYADRSYIRANFYQYFLTYPEYLKNLTNLQKTYGAYFYD